MKKNSHLKKKKSSSKKPLEECKDRVLKKICGEKSQQKKISKRDTLYQVVKIIVY